MINFCLHLLTHISPMKGGRTRVPEGMARQVLRGNMPGDEPGQVTGRRPKHGGFPDEEDNL